jgi:hypothetical protein
MNKARLVPPLYYQVSDNSGKNALQNGYLYARVHSQELALAGYNI